MNQMVKDEVMTSSRMSSGFAQASDCGCTSACGTMVETIEMRRFDLSPGKKQALAVAAVGLAAGIGLLLGMKRRSAAARRVEPVLEEKLEEKLWDPDFEPDFDCKFIHEIGESAALANVGAEIDLDDADYPARFYW